MAIPKWCLRLLLLLTLLSGCIFAPSVTINSALGKAWSFVEPAGAQFLFKFCQWPLILPEIITVETGQIQDVLVPDVFSGWDDLESNYRGTYFHFPTKYLKGDYYLIHYTPERSSVGGGAPATAVVRIDLDTRTVVILDSLDSVPWGAFHKLDRSIRLVKAESLASIADTTDAFECAQEVLSLVLPARPAFVINTIWDVQVISTALEDSLHWDRWCKNSDDMKRLCQPIVQVLDWQAIIRTSGLGNFYDSSEFMAYQDSVTSPHVLRRDDGDFQVTMCLWSPDAGGRLITADILIARNQVQSIKLRLGRGYLGYRMVWA